METENKYFGVRPNYQPEKAKIRNLTGTIDIQTGYDAPSQEEIEATIAELSSKKDAESQRLLRDLTNQIAN